MTASQIRTIIVDDEPLARRGIRARLAASGDVSVVGECANGRTAVESIHSLAPDLIFLDVQMPEVDGFGVVEAVTAKRMPIVIFVTAYDSHALRAFEAHAIDYLLKPIDDARFAQALGRVRERVRDRTAGALAQQLSALLDDVTRAGAASLDRVAVRDRGRLVLLDPRDIEWVAADGDYLRVNASARSYLVRETLTAMEARLPALRFVRIHRSSIVNVAHIAALEPLPNREFVVVLRDGTRLRSSRSYEDRLRRVLDALM